MHAFLLGVATGVPLMIAVGPIAILLVETGASRGFARAWPAGIGVAAADLFFASMALVGGASLRGLLAPFDREMRWIAAAVLAVLAVTMFRRSVSELRRRDVIAEASSLPQSPRSTRRDGWLAPRMFLATVMNPLTIVAFTSLVVATGSEASSVWWPVGIATASLGVHLALVGLGSVLSAALPPMGPTWFRVVGSCSIMVVAGNLFLSH